jgi:hypothetical protein
MEEQLESEEDFETYNNYSKKLTITSGSPQLYT